jgi:flagellar hook-length control protein FliK
VGQKRVASLAAQNMAPHAAVNKPAATHAAGKQNGAPAAVGDPLFAAMLAEDTGANDRAAKAQKTNETAQQDHGVGNTSKNGAGKSGADKTASDKEADNSASANDTTKDSSASASDTDKAADTDDKKEETDGKDEKKASAADGSQAMTPDAAAILLRMALENTASTAKTADDSAKSADMAAAIKALSAQTAGGAVKPDAGADGATDPADPDAKTKDAQAKNTDAAKAAAAGQNETSTKDAALLQSALKQAATQTQPQQATVTQAVSPNAGAAAKGGAQGDTGNKDDKGQKSATAAAPGKTDAATANPAPAGNATAQPPAATDTGQPHQQATATTAANTASPITAATQTTTMPGATLHIAPQSAGVAQALPPPDLSAFAVQIAARLNAGIKQFDIRLDPPELGRIDVKLSIDDAGKAQAHLAVEKPQTLDLMQKDSGSLQRALKEAGIELAQSGLQFSLKGQERQQDGGTNARPHGKPLHIAATQAIEAGAPATAVNNSYRAGDARLDIRV